MSRSARLALAGGCAAMLALAACSAGSSADPGSPGPATTRAQPTPGPASPAPTAAAGSSPAVVPGTAGAPPSIPGALSPVQLQAAYDVSPLLSQGITGRGQTIAIIIPFGSPTIRRDLAAYDKAWHVPAPPSFRVITPVGAIPPFRPTRLRTSYATEATLDVEAAHVMAPGAALLLVEAPSFGPLRRGRLPGFVKAMAYVIRRHLASVISVSLVGAEPVYPSLRQDHRAILPAGQPGSPVTIAAGSGDYGAAGFGRDGIPYRTPRIGWPASDPLVVAVGGTNLEMEALAGGSPIARATSWPGSGGGRSAVFARPPWQSTVAGVAGRWRAIPDISLTASAKSGLEMYATPRSVGAPAKARWTTGSGTSLATPLFAGVVALADQLAGRPLGVINPLLYQLAAQHDPGIVDVQGEDNTFSNYSITIPGYPAGPGYDLVTGLGTIDAAKFVPDLVRLAGQGRG